MSRLIPRITNPRTRTPEHIAQISASMQGWSWTNPILVGAANDVLATHDMRAYSQRANWEWISSCHQPAWMSTQSLDTAI
jgi:hypothetical protein